MKYCSTNDIELAIQILDRAIKNTKGTYTHDKIAPSINRVIFELEDLRRDV